MGRLSGKIALITGAARGQGAAAARRFAEEGAKVVVADILDEQGKELAAQLGDAAVYQHLDVASEGDWTTAVERTLAEFGGLNVLVNNAGILHIKSIVDTTVAEYERVIKVNQVGTFLGMRAVIPAMTDAGGGSIINVSSVEGLGGMAFLTAYTASKFAIRGMSKAAAMELGHLDIRVNSIHPGVIDTQMVRQAVDGVEVDMSRVGKRVALRRCGQPEEIANLQVFLASDESSYSTGAEFVADGGATATHSLL
ncbi:glucose 1-dehydrogenase [Kibdelosporangium phytohabitans]|uniref:3-alpha-hydroxysteroid dehydrogenase n=1 Tax=Kibdelosporangium phytohabitans TaxID=860235 RepID=A0A0N9I447_9PSEU|nr:glucose 1-dehydrogenase [Kibdelosporangium phytohabitans]ALG12638.1 3-alpha-hydroxysteroid dehydrogenase [Kibdelosporangium phytohabitans]MBE1464284.1 3alpha(or 20beta)-hydroxysteroid dehydrogenase [Kibdelosporangium phytohabitans]